VDSRPVQETPAKQPSAQQKSPPPVKIEPDPSGRAQVTVQSGRGYPEVRTSKIDVNGDPILPSVGKPISDIEVDADLVEHEKPWRRPGADQSDYFNYGFDEFTWSTYCMRQKTMGEALNEQKAESASFEMMMGGMGMPGMPQMPGAPAGPAAQSGMPTMPTMPGMDGMGMPNQEQMAAALQQAMIAQGVSDPSHVDFNLFMQQQMQGGGQMGQAGVPQGPAAQQHGGYGGGQQGWQGQGGGGGYGRGKRGQRW
jgi:pre-mRNA 3'-end-processing factor FIP1